VYVPPSIDKSNLISNPLGILGKDLWMDCPTSGVPEPVITWKRRNGERIPFAKGAYDVGAKYVLEQVGYSPRS
jgi:hypothetical protein